MPRHAFGRLALSALATLAVAGCGWIDIPLDGLSTDGAVSFQNTGYPGQVVKVSAFGLDGSAEPVAVAVGAAGPGEALLLALPPGAYLRVEALLSDGRVAVFDHVVVGEGEPTVLEFGS
jgi:hypothetical protein